MRPAVLLIVLSLAACGGDKLARVPPPGIDLSGRWKLNEADSDDPQRLLQAQINAPSPSAAASSGRGGRGGAASAVAPGPMGPAMPSVGSMAEGLRWPGRQLEIKQVEGTVAFSSDGVNVVCQPADGGADRHPGHGGDRGGGRDAGPRARDTLPPRCGWTENALIVMGGEPDDDHPPFEKRYSLSDDRQRLIEVVGFRGGRSGGFTMSRVWDRFTQ